jgi:hypothetical protein
MNFQEEEENMKLHQAVKKLPSYSPTDDVWLDILNQMNKEDLEQAKLSAVLAKLPQHEAPAMLWDAIEVQLPQTATKVLSIFSIARMAAAAALLGFAATLTLWWLATENQKDSVAYHYTTEQYDTTFKSVALTATEDELAFAQVAQICEQQAFLCEQAEIKQLRNTLEELNQARNELKEVLGEYDTDETLQQQLLAIEQERTDVLKKIMDQI